MSCYTIPCKMDTPLFFCNCLRDIVYVCKKRQVRIETTFTIVRVNISKASSEKFDVRVLGQSTISK